MRLRSLTQGNITVCLCCENPKNLRCKYIWMPPNKHNATSVTAVMRCENRIIVENPDLCWFGWTCLQQRSRFICSVSYWLLCESFFWKYLIVFTLNDLWCGFVRLWLHMAFLNVKACVCWVALGMTSRGSDHKILWKKKSYRQTDRAKGGRDPERDARVPERFQMLECCLPTLCIPLFPSSLITMVEISAVCECGEDGWMKPDEL